MCLKLQMVEWNPLLYIDIYIYGCFPFFFGANPHFTHPKSADHFHPENPTEKSQWRLLGKTPAF